MCGADNNIRPPLSEGIPGAAQHAIDKFQARHTVVLIERFDEWGQQRKGKRIIYANNQFILLAFVKFNRLLFEFADGVQHLPPLFQQHLPGTGKLSPMSAAIE